MPLYYMLIKLRGEVIHLNGYCFNKEIKLCSLCNRREVENVIHFIGTCPILKEFRIECFQNDTLSFEEILELLNGKDWPALLKFVKLSWNYRFLLVQEFNY
ncbi:hypothetical protein O3M35_012232 [Rhynocoris fuscipes]|uniref:Reverse transcriptase zinc-binding domain-containing protein n=1 Tax=Rhynocoris fuscipes TaxID=488301 RepID=A0AAW1CZN0_9HEMI